MRFVVAALLIALMTSCVAAPPRPVASAPVRVVTAPAPAAPVALPTDWRDWPQTPGEWQYQRTAAGSQATFGSGAVTIACGNDRQVRIERPAAGAGPLTVRTSSVTRALATSGTGTTLAAGDPLLDAIAFSRGRFVLEAAGAPTLVLPVWAEIDRVIEDCRA